ncbi:hypothetical protein CCMA1212_007870 [Trichoderma ghanense]|uniref:Uncharacterized protein n=1 Tax=Trichoderma ghanense TaxID=65468 RepID=A0ABY2GX91_9HYPO
MDPNISSACHRLYAQKSSKPPKLNRYQRHSLSAQSAPKAERSHRIRVSWQQHRLLSALSAISSASTRQHAFTTPRRLPHSLLESMTNGCRGYPLIRVIFASVAIRGTWSDSDNAVCVWLWPEKR